MDGNITQACGPSGTGLAKECHYGEMAQPEVTKVVHRDSKPDNIFNGISGEFQ